MTPADWHIFLTLCGFMAVLVGSVALGIGLGHVHMWYERRKIQRMFAEHRKDGWSA